MSGCNTSNYTSIYPVKICILYYSVETYHYEKVPSHLTMGGQYNVKAYETHACHSSVDLCSVGALLVGVLGGGHL